jgi:hypothetical protein
MVYKCSYGVKRRGLYRRTLLGRERYECIRHLGVLIRKGFRVFFTIVIDKIVLVDIIEVRRRKVYG